MQLSHSAWGGGSTEVAGITERGFQIPKQLPVAYLVAIGVFVKDSQSPVHLQQRWLSHRLTVHDTSLYQI